MKEHKTNFSMLLELYNISGANMARMTGADRTLVSRWTNGTRRLMPNNKWASLVSNVFLAADENPDKRFLPALMRLAYPENNFSKEDTRKNLICWLCVKEQTRPDNIEKRSILQTLLLSSDKNLAETPDAGLKSSILSRVTNGISEARETLLALTDYLETVSEPVRIIFICPEGIDMITREPEYGFLLLGKMTALFKRGFSLEVVLRTDFKMSDVSSMAGPWLVAHLMGYIKSWYYDDFRKIEADRMLISAGDYFSTRIYGNDWRCEVSSNEDEMQNTKDVCMNYIKRSKMRFHYEFFQKPDGYLLNMPIHESSAVFLFQRLPHFSIGGKTLIKRVGLNEKDSEKIFEQFTPFFIAPDELSPEAEIYHILCINDVEDALDQQKHLCHAISDMAGRKVFMSTQTLTEQLVELWRLCKEKHNYHLCFMNSEVFDKIIMEISVWDSCAAVGWIQGGRSTVTKNYTNTSTLLGFCQVVWDKIPRLFKSKITANRNLKKLLNRAKRMGYDVNAY